MPSGGSRARHTFKNPKPYIGKGTGVAWGRGGTLLAIHVYACHMVVVTKAVEHERKGDHWHVPSRTDTQAFAPQASVAP